jgi:hypothetical protein
MASNDPHKTADPRLHEADEISDQSGSEIGPPADMTAEKEGPLHRLIPRAKKLQNCLHQKRSLNPSLYSRLGGSTICSPSRNRGALRSLNET